MMDDHDQRKNEWKQREKHLIWNERYAWQKPVRCNDKIDDGSNGMKQKSKLMFKINKKRIQQQEACLMHCALPIANALDFGCPKNSLDIFA